MADEFLERNFGIKSLLCLASTQQDQAEPIVSSECLRRSIPVRVLATIKAIESGTTFSVSFNNDPRSFKEFDWRLNAFYSDSNNQLEVDFHGKEGNIVVGSHYVCRIGSSFHRCRLDQKISYNKFMVFLIDVGKTEEVNLDDLFELHIDFFGDLFSYGFALLCSTPDSAFLQSMGLPTLDQFEIDDIVEVVICSVREPCLAVLGSITKHFSRIRPENLTLGLDDNSLATWQSNFSISDDTIEGVLHGQYPAAQPLIFESSSIVTLVSCDTLERIYVRDLVSSIRLSILREMINDFYQDDQCRTQMEFPEVSLSPNLPCIVFDPISKQFLRAKVLRYSSDQSIVDAVAVDYPNLYFKGTSRQDIIFLCDKFNLPPQCFSIGLVNCPEKLQLHRFTKFAKNFLNDGLVASVSLPAKSMLANLICTNDRDLLDIIDYHELIRANTMVNRELLQRQAELHGKSLASATFGNMSTKPPLDSIDVIITHVRSANEIYYRTAELSKSYAALKFKISEVLRNKTGLFPLDLYRLKEEMEVGVQLLKVGIDSQGHRIRILNNDSSEVELDVDYEYIDSGERSQLIEGSDNVYRIPIELEEWPSTLMGPCRLAVVTDNIEASFFESPSFVSELMNLIPANGRCSLCQNVFIKNGQFCSSTKETNAVTLFNPDGSSINEAYAKIVDKLRKEWN